ncbi:MAG: two-component system response regulator [Deltaproteobacteria bacterium]|nr:MAG: two-component system response regulator [Deltaproteobacteria bacterium]
MSESRLPKILVADDDLEIQKMVRAALTTIGARLITAADGNDALDKLRREKPDLLILDVMMPGKSGWEVMRELRQDEALKGTRVLMLTAIGQNVNEATSPLIGADDYLDKPFNFDELAERVRSLLDQN